MPPKTNALKYFIHTLLESKVYLKGLFAKITRNLE